MTSGAIGPEAAFRNAAPHLVTVALPPVVDLCGYSAYFFGLFNPYPGGGALYVLGRHRFHPFGRDQLLPSPLSVLEQEQAHLCHILSLKFKAPATCVDTIFIGLPNGLFYAKGLKKTGSQIVQEAFT